MKISRVISTLGMVGVLTAPAQAQQITLGFDELGHCTGTSMSTYASWLAIAAGVTCQTGSYSVISANSTDNYLRSAGNMSWSFMNGPVVFNGLYASGYGTYWLDLMSGGNVVHSRWFTAMGSNIFVGSNGYGGQIDGVRVRLYAGYGILGVDDISFLGTQSTQQTTGGEEEEEQEEQEEDPGPGDNEGDLDNLVNNANSTPEPATMLLVATGLGGVSAMMRRRKKNNNQA
jgi:hypothetical protein